MQNTKKIPCLIVIEVLWYFESYLTSTKDFVSVTKNGKTETVLEMPLIL
jgi:hypothetical protein